MIEINLSSPRMMKMYLPTIMLMDSAIDASERWEQGNFLADFPGKWECSRIVLDGEKFGWIHDSDS